MSELVEQIEALLALNDKGAVSHQVPGIAVELLERAATALRTQPSDRGEVRVRPLEWKGPSSEEAYAEQGGFLYTIRSPNRTPGWRVWVALKSADGMASIGGCIVTVRAENLESAMAAAQADYERRILSTLETTPPAIGEAAEPVASVDHHSYRVAHIPCPQFIADPCGSPRCAGCGKRRAEHHPAPSASREVTVTDEMVERALAAQPFGKATVGDLLQFGRGTPNPPQAIRAALTAALSSKGGENG